MTTDGWWDLGIRVLVLMLDDPGDVKPPTAAGALTLKNTYGMDHVAVAADPWFRMVVGGSVGTPQHTYIDPRNMEVLSRVEGGGINENLLKSTAIANKLQ